MAKFYFDRIVTLEEIKGMVEKTLGPGFRIAMKKNRIEIVQDGTKGCIIQVKEKQGRTVCKAYGYMPSVALRFAVVSGVLGFLSLISLTMGKGPVIGGIIPILISYCSSSKLHLGNLSEESWRLWKNSQARHEQPNNGMQRTALRAAADAGRWAA